MLALAVSGPPATAGPPAGLCRHHTKTWCEEALGPYSAFQFLLHEVMTELRARSVAPRGFNGGCDRRHRPGVYRCTLEFEGGTLSAHCVVEALLSRQKPTGFRFRWRKESAACKA